MSKHLLDICKICGKCEDGAMQLDCTPEEVREIEDLLARISERISTCELQVGEMQQPEDGWEQRAEEAVADLQRAFGD